MTNFFLNIRLHGEFFVVTGTFNPGAVHAWRTDVARRTYDPTLKANVLPVNSIKHLDALLKMYYDGYSITWTEEAMRAANIKRADITARIN